MVKELIFNERVFIKRQMSILFSVLVLFSFGTILGLCLGLLNTLGDEAQTTAEDRILSRTYHDAKADGREIAAAIEKKLSTITQGTSMTTTHYSSLLLESNYLTTTSNDLRFPSRNTYKEYNFVNNCSPPLCPSDFGPLNSRSRVPNMNGSMESTSLYLYSSRYQQGIKSDSVWQIIMSDKLLNYTMYTLSTQDSSFATSYPLSDDLMFLYLTVRISGTEIGEYNVLHRVFPGTIRDDPNYDPSQRPWFTRATNFDITLQGPYVETFSRKNVLTLSTQLQIPTSLEILGGRTITVVGATVLKLDSILKIVTEMRYPNNGFGVLLKYDTLQVIVWGNITDTYDSSANRFLVVSDFDPSLSGKVLRKQHAFRHVDPDGTKWLISSTPFMRIRDEENYAKEFSLIFLVYSKWNDAFVSIPLLTDNIDETETSVTLLVSIIALVVTVVMLAGINLFVVWFMGPLQTILNISHEILKLSSEEEKSKDYLPFVDLGIHTASSRTDEIGMLSSIFWQMIWKLHQDNLKKKQTPKYPVNPFYSEALRSHSLYGSYLLDTEELSPELFLSLNDVLNLFPDHIPPSKSLREATAPELNDVGVEMAPTDVLSRIGYQLALGQDPETVPGDLNTVSSPNRKPRSHQIKPSIGNEEEEVSYPGPIVRKTLFTLAFYLSSIGMLICLGLCSLVVITIVFIRSESYSWMDETGKSLTAQQTLNLYTITEAKAQFSKAYFDRASLDTQVLSRHFTELLDGYIVAGSFPYDYEFRSYSNDPNNAYSYYYSSSPDFSGYFYPDSANCGSALQCAFDHSSQTTKVTSLADVSMKSLFYPDSLLSFVQFGLESNGFSRTYPYAWTTYGQPTQCYASYLESQVCLDKYQNTQCSGKSQPYPAYDPRCRPWYGTGSKAGASPLLTYFQEPKKAANGKFVLTAVTPLRSQSSVSGTKLGVLNLNILANDLSDSVNSFKILDSGYIYILNARNLSTVILHPRATATCSTLLCCEKGFTSVEYAEFYSILSSLSSSTSQDTNYSKGGKNWILVNSGFVSGTVDYLVIATVPMSDILEPSRTVDNSIDTTVAVIIAISVIIIVLFLSFIVWCILLLIHAIQSPIHHLTAVCQNIISNQLTMTSLPEEIQCRDMKILLDTFKNIVIVLRFGNEAYISGNIRKALQVYTEALSLYETLSNEKGMSACLNNLGGIYLTMKDFTQSEVHYQRSISMASQQLSKLGEVFEKNPSDDLKAQMTSLSQTLSDRQANYTLLLIEEEKYAEAYSLLESCLEDDLKRGYINGCVNKQGYLGFLYLRQNEMKSAEKQFLNSLLFLDNHQNQSKLLSGAWTMEEIEVSKQIALFNYGKLSEDKRDVTAAIHYYVMSLEYPAKMHLMTTIKTLSRLYSIHSGGNSFDSSYLSSSSSSLSGALKKFEKICEDLSLSIANKSHSSVVKRIAIALDYSGSMSGMKIRSATENILSLFDEQIQPQDQLMLLHFNSQIIIDVRPFTLKEGHEDQIRAIIRSLNQPSHGTALYDAMNECIRCMTTNHPGTAPVAPGNDWIVVLTDGEDTGSMMSKDAIQRSFSQGSYGVILIGVGADVNHSELEKIALSSPRGFYVKASGDKEGITRAFGEVRNLMQENIVFEDI